MKKIFHFIKNFSKLNLEKDINNYDLTSDKLMEKKRLKEVELSSMPIYRKTGILYTGSIKERNLKKKSENFCVPGTICDCCGTSLIIWSNDSLCPRCKNRLDEQLLEAARKRKNQLIFDKVWFYSEQ